MLWKKKNTEKGVRNARLRAKCTAEKDGQRSPY